MKNKVDVRDIRIIVSNALVNELIDSFSEYNSELMNNILEKYQKIFKEIDIVTEVKNDE